MFTIANINRSIISANNEKSLKKHNFYIIYTTYTLYKHTCVYIIIKSKWYKILTNQLSAIKLNLPFFLKKKDDQRSKARM